MAETAYALWAISEELLSMGDVSKSITCLEAIIQSGIRYYPEIQLKTNLRVSELYIKYTQNFDRAKQLLDNAISCTENLKNETEYNILCYYLLSRVYHKTGQTNLHKQILKQGLKYESHSLWYQYFQLELATIYLAENNTTGLLECLNLGAQSALKKGDQATQILFSHTKIQYFLNNEDYNQAESLLNEVENQLNQFLSQQQQTPALGDDGNVIYEDGVRLYHANSPVKSPAAKLMQRKTALYTMLQTHYHLLNTIFLINTGNYATAFKMLENLHQLIKSISSMDIASVFYYWLPQAILYSTTYLLSAITNRPFSNIQTTIGFCNKGIQLIDSILSRELFDKNGFIQSEQVDYIKSLINLKYNLLESIASSCLTTCNLNDAILTINQMALLFEAYPQILENEKYIINVLLGLFSIAINYLPFAVSHLNRALENCNNEDSKTIIRIHLCVVLLQQNNIEMATNIVYTNLKPQANHPTKRIIRAGVALCEGLLSFHSFNGNTEVLQQAKIKIKECMSIANGSLSHNQLAAMSLNILGDIFLQEDFSLQHIPTVLKSSLVLSHRSDDVFSKLHALTHLSSLYEKNKDYISQSHNMNYKISTTNLWRDSVESTFNIPETKYLLESYLGIGTPSSSSSNQQQEAQSDIVKVIQNNEANPMMIAEGIEEQNQIQSKKHHQQEVDEEEDQNHNHMEYEEVIDIETVENVDCINDAVIKDFDDETDNIKINIQRKKSKRLKERNRTSSLPSSTSTSSTSSKKGASLKKTSSSSVIQPTTQFSPIKTRSRTRKAMASININ
eukprot:TRINITY_DN9640_c0_g1_i1.p1 TRINITY_DN9640_c0_g1~~TRINITY_DN9640_c0_g1_i1.p1  ORF type:complete len:792 (+),score=178.24 TRINITY_DN9640_c0_g1_i1:10-2385(+)